MSPMYVREQAHQILAGAKSRLEESMLEGSTSDVVKGVTYIQVKPPSSCMGLWSLCSSGSSLVVMTLVLMPVTAVFRPFFHT